MPIIISSLRLHKLDDLKHCIELLNREQSPPIPWEVKELQPYDVAGIPIMRFALICTKLPPPELEIPMEAVISDNQYCPECLKEDIFKPLSQSNRSGYCSKHREKHPDRMYRKRSPKNRGKHG